MEPSGPFWFVPQTGQVYNHLPRSNYYAYHLPPSCFVRVWEAIQRAPYGPSGLEYPDEWVAWLHENDLNEGK